MSLGDDIVLAITKKSKSRKMRSVIDDIEKVASTLFRLLSAIVRVVVRLVAYAGSLSRSMNSIVLPSNWRTTESMRATK